MNHNLHGTQTEHETGPTGPSHLRLKRLGIDTYREHVIYMRADCHVCLSEGFAARSRVRVSANGSSLLATLNVVHSDLLGPDEAGLSEVAWQTLGARDGDPVDVKHPHPIESESFVRAKAYGERLGPTAFDAIIRDIAAGEYSELHLAAFVTACAGDRLDIDETTALTRAMIAVGDSIAWPYPVVADKHSVGGLPGNRTTICPSRRPHRAPSPRRQARPTPWRLWHPSISISPVQEGCRRLDASRA